MTYPEIIRKAIALRHDLHQHPELSGEETWTKQRLMGFLRENTSLSVVDRGAWFYAKYAAACDAGQCAASEHGAKAPGGAIAFRADFDAVAIQEDGALPYASRNPGVAHKCGHDGHSGALCAFAMMVEEEGADRDVYFIFQHAEETGQGAEPVSALVEEERIKEIYGIHNYPGMPFGSVNIKPGVICCASLGMELIFTGTPAHASTPELGKNPAQTVSRLVLELDELKARHAKKGMLLATVVQIAVGERAFGISAAEGRLLLTARGEDESELERFVSGIREKAEELCEEAGISLGVNFYDRFPATCNDENITEKIRQICGENGIPVIDMQNPLRTSEDFGWFLKKAPGALIWLGAGEAAAPLHDKDYDYNDDLIAESCRLFRLILKDA